MKKRLRKKLHLAEFTEYGFDLFVTFKAATDEEHCEALYKLADWLADQGYECGGGGALPNAHLFVCGRGRRSLTESDRGTVMLWLVQNSDVDTADVSELIDAWNGKY